MKFTELEKELKKENKKLQEELEQQKNGRIRTIRFLYESFLKEPSIVTRKIIRDVFEYRWGISSPKFQTLEEAGKHFDISRERCRALEDKFISDIKEVYNLGLKEYKKRTAIK